MASATAMYHTGYNPLRSLKAKERVQTVKGLERRRLHKAFLRYHDPHNWPVLREALRRMGRTDLIGGTIQFGWAAVGVGGRATRTAGAVPRTPVGAAGSGVADPRQPPTGGDPGPALVDRPASARPRPRSQRPTPGTRASACSTNS
jgi:hypothetical protein